MTTADFQVLSLSRTCLSKSDRYIVILWIQIRDGNKTLHFVYVPTMTKSPSKTSSRNIQKKVKFVEHLIDHMASGTKTGADIISIVHARRNKTIKAELELKRKVKVDETIAIIADAKLSGRKATKLSCSLKVPT